MTDAKRQSISCQAMANLMEEFPELGDMALRHMARHLVAAGRENHLRDAILRVNVTAEAQKEFTEFLIAEARLPI